MLTAHDIDHLDDIIAGKDGDRFTAKLLRLIKHADSEKRALLHRRFPKEGEAVRRWEVDYPTEKILETLGR